MPGSEGQGPQREAGRGGGTYQSVCGSSMTSSSLNFLPAAEEPAEDGSTRPAEAAVCFTALESELKKLLPADCCGGGCCCWGGADCGGCRRSAAGEPEAGAEEAEGGGGGGCCGSGRCRSVM